MVIVVEPLTEQRNSIGSDIVVVTVVKQLPRLAKHQLQHFNLYFFNIFYSAAIPSVLRSSKHFLPGHPTRN